jgi:probable HAF family extracellular repeat protein
MRALVRIGATAALLSGLALTGAPAAAGPAGVQYRTVTLGTLGGPGSVPHALNDRGEVVGWADTGEGYVHPFLWRGGRMVDLGTLDRLDGGWGLAADINRHGTVAGQSRRGDVTRAVRWQNGKITELGTLGGDSSFATAINDLGTIVGSSMTADGSLHAFLWRDGRMTDLGVPGVETFAEDINNRGQVVGWRVASEGPAAGFLWQRGTVTLLPGTRYGSRARAINDYGVIAGSVYLAESSQAARWRHGRLEALGNLPGGNASAARDVNERGVILGGGNRRPDSLEDHAFLWRRGVFRDLSTEGIPQNASALNNRNAIIGVVPNSAGDAPLAALFLPHSGAYRP